MATYNIHFRYRQMRKETISYTECYHWVVAGGALTITTNLNPMVCFVEPLDQIEGIEIRENKTAD